VKRWTLSLTLSAAILAAVAASPLRAVEHPIGHVQVAYRQVAEGKPDKLVYLTTLTCYGDLDCELSTVELNWCVPSLAPGASDAYRIGVERSSTADGSLKVRSTIARDGTTGSIVAEEEPEGAKITYRFEFTLSRPVANMYPSMDKLLTLSGAAVKNSIVAKKVVSWTLEPLKGEWSIFEPGCKLMLPGVPVVK
jgi:hypothetical protein